MTITPTRESRRARPIRPGPRAAWDPLVIQAEVPVPETEPPALVAIGGETEPPPDPARWSGVLARAVVEVLIGTRPAAQVRRWLAEEVWTVVNRRAELSRAIRGRAGTPPAVTVLRVHHCAISDGEHEAAVVVHDGTRVRAVAVRLHLHRGRWQAVALRIA
ncbi:hypothetical protein GCG21_02420 [Pseudactinotalea sp. HY160]|uniref:Rv3235 family protein n=1 Tax=Pseudactinotalea sp. HY160 TaxID=2654490 RepID=UPI00128B995E|nr:Rv3235 family protein [Pseudactinotalea sp. HY160]MPV48882.1 hypothetical protein [Pseudactinotalea sp. HY160]